jgi:hypothetical protein
MVPPPSAEPAADLCRIHAAQARGARYVELQSGIYLLPRDGLILRPEQALIGHGAGRTALRATAMASSIDHPLVSCPDANHVEVRGLSIDCAGVREPAPLWSAVSLQAINNVHLQDLAVVGFPRFGLSVTGGSSLWARRIKNVRSQKPLDRDGKPIPARQQSQAIVITQADATPVQHVTMLETACIGAAVNTCGSYIVFDHLEVDGFTFGGGVTTEAHPNSHHVEIIHSRIHGGRGRDINDTVCLGLEIWSPNSLVEDCEIFDMGGAGIAIGGKQSVVRRNKFRSLGRNARSVGIGARYAQEGRFSAEGSQIDGNIVELSAGLETPYHQDGPAHQNIAVRGNSFRAPVR